ncbi:MAG: O-antigen ligase family protein [Patescibacteria group bacterium]|nr:O-antigen ligase family protein [Patescibacteria group bacterium]
MNFNRKQFFWFLILYFGLRLFSYFFTPPTPLLAGSIVNTAVSTALALWGAYWLIKNDARGWLIVAGEIIFCGSGNILSIGSISLRTILLAVSLTIFFIHILRKKQFTIFHTVLAKIIFLVVLWGAAAAVIGLNNGHQSTRIFSDFIPYLFLLYYFPLLEWLKNERFKNTCFNMIIAALGGGAVMLIFTLFAFSFGWLAMQGAYYHWFRDVAGGKITDLGTGFFRLVLNEHLLLIPLLLWFIFRQITKPAWINIGLILASSAILAVNLTRVYFLALVIGLAWLFSRANWRRWLKYSVLTLAGVFVIFTVFYSVTSRGHSLGWEFFGIRLQSIAAPQIEDSSLSRLLLLPKIMEKIKTAPVLGQGLGDTVTVYSPVLAQEITTPHFDWGYLEILAEMGVIGLLFWLSLIGYLIFLGSKKTTAVGSSYLSPLIALMVINITAPAFFHVLGIVTIAITAAVSHASAPQSASPLQIPSDQKFSTVKDKQTPATIG